MGLKTTMTRFHKMLYDDLYRDGKTEKILVVP